MKNSKLFILLAVVLVLAGAAFFMFSGGKQKPMVSLEAFLDKTEYQAGEAIELTLHLNNTGGVDTCVSDIAAGSISFASITRDGEPVETRSVPANYIASFPKLLEASLETIGPGEDLHVTLPSENDPGLGARALATTALENDTGIVTFYNVEEPGEYALELVYRYVGPASSDCPSVFEGPSNTANVIFTVPQ